MQLNSYNVRDHYWLASDGRVFASARLAVVDEHDAAFVAWQESGRAPARWPGDQTLAALQAEVFDHYGLFVDPAVDLAVRIKSECERRIYAEVSDNAQKNILAYFGELAFVAPADRTAEQNADIDLAKNIRAWISSMQGACRSMIFAGDQDFADDAKWPAPPVGAAAFIARF